MAWEKSPGALAEATIARDNTCECCRIAVAFAGPGKPVVVFRNIFDGGVRDHAVITFHGATPGPLERVSDDNAKLDACPHHGPSIAVAPDGTYHVTWFALGRKLKGLFYARSEDGGKHFSAPMPLGDSARQVSRPYVLAGDNGVYLAYKTFDGERTTIEVKSSRDGGKTWSAAQVAAGTDAEFRSSSADFRRKIDIPLLDEPQRRISTYPVGDEAMKASSASCASCWFWVLAQRRRRRASRGRSMARAGAS